MDQLITLDKQLLLYLNSLYSHYGDVFYYIFTQTITWVPFYVLLALAFFRHHGLRGLVSILFVVIVITLCDQISSTFLKEFVQRYRPSHDPVLKNLVHLVGGRVGKPFGFVSSHAANSMGLAVFTALIFRNRYYTLAILAWALINSYSRIYVGLHFPGDILGGWIIGILVATLVYQLYLSVLPRFVVISHHNKRTLKKSLSHSFGRRTPAILALSLVIITATILISAKIILKLL